MNFPSDFISKYTFLKKKKKSNTLSVGMTISVLGNPIIQKILHLVWGRYIYFLVTYIKWH